MPHSIESWDGRDDLARQRRKRQARLLDLQLIGSPELTLGDVVADVLAARSSHRGTFDVRGYLATAGHHRRTVDAVVDYVRTKDATEAHPSRWLP